MDAIASYEELVKEGYSEQEIYASLGNANYLNAQYAEAARWYGKLLELLGPDMESEYLYRYAQVLKSTGDYKASDKVMERFKEASSKDNRAVLFKDKKDYLKTIEANSGRYAIKNLTINSAVSDFSPAFHKDGIAFATARDTGITSRKIHQWNKGAFLNLYLATKDENGDLGKIERFPSELNSKTHESSAVFTPDGKTVYFTRNNADNNRFKRDGKGISRLKIFKAERIADKWTNITELPFNEDGYSVAHPALSADGKMLYFSSDMPGSLGASDIFSVTINDDGSYGKPTNLGTTVNTESRETFPYVVGSTLYFASDGHPGLGGLDVFATKLDGSSMEVLNLGRPINGQQDDFSFIINNSGEGYFASNRTGGMGDDDIYAFQENEALQFECLVTLKGRVMDAITQSAIAEAQISVVDADGKIINSMTSDANGMFDVPVDCATAGASLVVNKQSFATSALPVHIKPGRVNEVEVKLAKEPIRPVFNNGADLISGLGLEPILFDLDSAEIRQDAALVLKRAAAYLKENPGLQIEIQSHTDAKASDTYNQKLSQARAKATFDYLVLLGVNPQNMTYQGYGENQLVNDCKNWKQCSKKENERNRRSELIVVKLM